MAQYRLAAHTMVVLACLPWAQSLRARSRTPSSNGSCVVLKNRGSHSTVQVSVGTPTHGTSPQTFDVVADTGSDNLIVASCLCVDDGNCKEGTNCFRGRNRSSTFAIEDDPMGVTITFGSGPVQSVIATDTVEVGDTQATMKDSLLLMVNKKLKPAMELEGILGLGLPSRQNAKQDGKTFSAPGFLETAGVSRFSVCFNSGEDGVLRLGGSPRGTQLAAVGQTHWSVDFRGVTMVDAQGSDTKGGFCESTTDGMRRDKKTACGAIVDSGTTMITAPATQLAKFMQQLCNAWPKCKESGHRNATEAVASTLTNCDMEAMPTIKFHVAGAEGDQQTLELEPKDYVLETQRRIMKVTRRKLLGIFPIDTQEPTGDTERVCIPAFQAMEWDTERNGPVWIFGTPFFYKYTVGYDTSTAQPKVSFGNAACATCSASMAESLVARRSSTLRTLSTLPREPSLDAGAAL